MKPHEAEHLDQITSIAFQDNPMMKTIYQTDGTELLKNLENFFRGLFTDMPLETYVAELDGKVIGYIRSGPCTGDWNGRTCSEKEYDYIIKQKIEDLSIEQRWKWVNKISDMNDLSSPHSHVGPIIVLPELQRKGIGTLLMKDYLARLGDAVSFLETFQMPNVRFYEKNGYYVVDTEIVLGVKGYWMKRG